MELIKAKYEREKNVREKQMKNKLIANANTNRNNKIK